MMTVPRAVISKASPASLGRSANYESAFGQTDLHVRSISCCILALGLLTSCNRSFKPNNLEGSWLYNSSVAQAKWTYFPDNTWLMSVTGATNGRLSGDWTLDGNRLS